jgi:acyl-CoA thioester hydrolase
LKIFTTELQVPASAIDALQHVNNVAYLQWVQDVAEKHWVESTTETLREKYVWVVVNHFIEYKAPAFENDILELQTWVENYSGVTSERHTKIIRKKDQKLLAQAKTLWCLLDAKNGKPLRINEDLKALFP